MYHLGEGTRPCPFLVMGNGRIRFPLRTGYQAQERLILGGRICGWSLNGAREISLWTMTVRSLNNSVLIPVTLISSTYCYVLLSWRRCKLFMQHGRAIRSFWICSKHWTLLHVFYKKHNGKKHTVQVFYKKQNCKWLGQSSGLWYWR